MQSALRAALALALFTCGCAGSRLQPTTTASSDAPGYALAHPGRLDAALAQFERDRKQARELAAALPARASELKPSNERELVLRVIDEADAAGRSQRLRSSLAEQRALRRFWDEERGALSGRVGSAAQKQVSEAGCTQVELQGTVSASLRDGFERQLERRVRAENEAQRTLEQNKARLPAGSLPVLQRLADDVALASQLANVALVDDLRELEQLTSEQRAIDATLKRSLDEERAIQSRPRSPAEQRSSQERVMQIEKSRAELKPAVARAESALHEYEDKLKVARDDYDRGLSDLKTRVPEATAKAAEKPSAKAAQKPSAKATPRPDSGKVEASVAVQ